MNAGRSSMGWTTERMGGTRLVAVCSSCKKTRTSAGTWRKLSARASAGLDASEITHTICPRCIRALYPELER